jgi:hypothetical protein
MNTEREAVESTKACIAMLTALHSNNMPVLDELFEDADSDTLRSMIVLADYMLTQLAFLTEQPKIEMLRRVGGAIAQYEVNEL